MMAKHISEIPSTTTSSNETQPSKLVRKFSDSIPVDMLIEIFSRVPADSIARFRCLSKLWAHILDRPDFTERFLSKSWTRPRLLFILTTKKKVFFYSSPQNLDKGSCLVATRYQYHTYLPQDFPSLSCTLVNGLALLRGYLRDVNVIRNPATGEFLTLPKVEVKTDELYFGYDPIGKQFKVLCMTKSEEERPNTHMVLTLENNGKPNSWRRIDHKFHFVKNSIIRGDVCINGVLYFGAEVDGSMVIISFDVRSEKFGFINTNTLEVGEEISLWDTPYLHCILFLFNYKGKLALHYSNIDSWCYSQQDLVFWALEDAENHHWSKHVYSLSDLGKDIVIRRDKSFVGMTTTGDLVWSPRHFSNTWEIFFYNLESKTFKIVSVQGFQEFKDCTIYVDTFLDYEENITKNNTWSLLKHTRNVDVSRKNRARAEEEKHVSSSSNNKSPRVD